MKAVWEAKQRKFRDVEKPSYYAVVPANVRYSSISPNAKLLFGELTCLCGSEGFCWASNGYLAKLYDAGERTVSRWLLELEKASFIRIEPAVNQHGQRRIFIADALPKVASQKWQAKNGDHNNTSEENITSKGITPIAPKGAEPVDGAFEDFWKAYPKKVGKPAALRAFKTAKAEPALLMAGLSVWLKSTEWQKDKGQYIPHPSTFLNQRRWENRPHSMAAPETDLERRNREFMESLLQQANTPQQKQIA